MVNFIPGRNREFFGNRAGYHAGKTSGQFYGGPSNLPQGGGFHFGKTSGQYYGGPINPPGAGLAAPLSPPHQGGPGMGGQLPPFDGNAERPGVYGNPGQFQPMPRGPLPDIPVDGRANLPGMGQPPGGPYGAEPGPGFANTNPIMGNPLSSPRPPSYTGPATPGNWSPGGGGGGQLGMGQPPGGGVTGFTPGMGTGVSGNPFTPDPNNIVRGGGSMGGDAFAGNGMRRWGNRPLLSGPNMRGL